MPTIRITVRGWKKNYLFALKTYGVDHAFTQSARQSYFNAITRVL